MQEECLKASFRINRLNLHDAANPRVGCGMFELSSNETQLMLGRSNDMFKHEPSISRKHLQLTLQKDGTVEAVRVRFAFLPPAALRGAIRGRKPPEMIQILIF